MFSFLTSFITILLILSFLVIIHELGHFLTARFFKMKVEEFGLGYPPKIKAFYKDKLGTIYTLNWLPFGGFVRLYGEDGEESVEDKKTSGAFFTKPAWQRLIVILAGAAVNFVFGVLVFMLVYAYFGVVPEYRWHAQVSGIVENSPAAEAGLEIGDEIEYVVSDRGTRRILTSTDLIAMLSRSSGKEVTLLMKNGEEKIVYVRTVEEIPEGQGATGIEISDRTDQEVEGTKSMLLGAKTGVIEAGLFSRMLMIGLGDMVMDAFKGEAPADVSGLFGIAHTVHKEKLLTDIVSTLNFMAIISINLAIVNLLPIPALDGGRAMMIIIEVVTRRKVNPDLERRLNTIGFLVLISLIILVTINDIRKVAIDYNVDTMAVNAYDSIVGGNQQLVTLGSLTLALFLTGLMVYFAKRKN